MLSNSSKSQIATSQAWRTSVVARGFPWEWFARQKPAASGTSVSADEFNFWLHGERRDSLTKSSQTPKEAERSTTSKRKVCWLTTTCVSRACPPT